jgi:transposase InsO family protein
MDALSVSERRACRALGQHRSTQRKVPRGRDDEAALTADLIELARRYGRYGYRKIGALLKAAGWLVNDKRVERIWRREGLKVPAKQPKRGRLWERDGSCIRLRPEHRNHVWSYDFVEARTHEGRKFRMLNVIDEFSRECLAIRVERKLKADDVVAVLCDLFSLRGVPAHIRSDNGPEFVARSVQSWIATAGSKTAYITPGSPWENGYVESFNAQVRDELLDGEIFYTLKEAQIMIEDWRRHYNCSSERTSRYVIDAKRDCCAGCGTAGCLPRFSASCARALAAGPSRAVRLKTQGPSASGCAASISPRSAARRRVRAATPTRAAAWVRFSQGSSPSAASQNTEMRYCERNAVTRSRVKRLPCPVLTPLRLSTPAITSSRAMSASVRTASITSAGVLVR